MSILKLATL